MSVPDAVVATPIFTSLQELDVERVRPNDQNPRLIFPPEEIEKLAESIENEGILVPIVVYPDGEEFVLIDGERRFRCAKILGLKKVPAVVTSPKSPRENLVQMFNIHLIREPWKDMPTAWALGRLIDDIKAETGREPNDGDLSNLTGLSRERISRYRHALTLSEEYQGYINDGTIPLNWFWELKRNVIEPMVRQRPKVAEEFGEEGITEAFVGKRLDGVITDTVSLRDVRPIINFAAKDADTSEDQESVLDGTLRDLITDPNQTIEDAYQDSVQIMVEADKLERRTGNMVTSFQRLLTRVRTDDEREHVVSIGKAFIERLKQVLR
ncbi:ParB/RepB/Spo0J family partition protein [Micromonospora sp. NPDC005173]|uniref:ParB/RepB/Spo0J family partition protein n=1 Tax=Micromonospora sp. NPDC005173 TaxID=3157165 RepID=UPI0033BBFB9E